MIPILKISLKYKPTSKNCIVYRRNITIQVEESPVLPTTEGSSDANYVIGSGVADIVTGLTNSTAALKTLSLIPMKYGRLKITGIAGNGSDTTLDLRIFFQELIA